MCIFQGAVSKDKHDNSINKTTTVKSKSSLFLHVVHSTVNQVTSSQL